MSIYFISIPSEALFSFHRLFRFYLSLLYSLIGFDESILVTMGRTSTFPGDTLPSRAVFDEHYRLGIPCGCASPLYRIYVNIAA